MNYTSRFCHFIKHRKWRQSRFCSLISRITVTIRRISILINWNAKHCHSLAWCWGLDLRDYSISKAWTNFPWSPPMAPSAIKEIPIEQKLTTIHAKPPNTEYRYTSIYVHGRREKKRPGGENEGSNRQIVFYGHKAGESYSLLLLSLLANSLEFVLHIHVKQVASVATTLSFWTHALFTWRSYKSIIFFFYCLNLGVCFRRTGSEKRCSNSHIYSPEGYFYSNSDIGFSTSFFQIRNSHNFLERNVFG